MTKKGEAMGRQITIRMPDDLYERLELAAAADHRKPAQLIRLMIEESMADVERRIAARDRAGRQGDG